MRSVARIATFLAGSLVLAAFFYVILALPGVVSDRDSAVPVQSAQRLRP